jgi:hypothetical protein
VESEQGDKKGGELAGILTYQMQAVGDREGRLGRISQPATANSAVEEDTASSALSACLKVYVPDKAFYGRTGVAHR